MILSLPHVYGVARVAGTLAHSASLQAGDLVEIHEYLVPRVPAGINARAVFVEVGGVSAQFQEKHDRAGRIVVRAVDEHLQVPVIGIVFGVVQYPVSRALMVGLQVLILEGERLLLLPHLGPAVESPGDPGRWIIIRILVSILHKDIKLLVGWGPNRQGGLSAG